MTPREACDQLLNSFLESLDKPEVEPLLLAAGAAAAESAAYLTEWARAALGTAPAHARVAAILATTVADRSRIFTSSAAARRVQGQACRILGDHRGGIAAFEAAAASAAAAGDALLAAQVQIGAIDSLGMLGQYEEAIALARRLEAVFRALGAAEDTGKILFNIGGLHFRRDRYADALDCYERAGEMFVRQSAPPALMARLDANRANTLTPLGRIAEAVALYERARNVLDGLGQSAEAAVVDTNIGFLRYVSGEHAAALAALTRARQDFETAGRPLDSARADTDTGEVYRALNLYPEALECFERAIRVFENSSIEYDHARAALGRGGVLVASGKLDTASEALDKADAVFRVQKNALQRAHVQLIRASLLRAAPHREATNNAAAMRAARAAARVFSRHGLEGWTAETRFIAAEIALEEAGAVSTRSMALVLRAAKRTARGWLESRAERALGLYYARHGNVTKALRHLRFAVAALEAARTLIAPEDLHVSFLHDKLAVYEDLVDILLSRGRPRDIAEALEYVERAKSRLLVERLQSALAGRFVPLSENAATAPVREHLAGLRAELSREYHRLHSLDDGGSRRLTGSNVGASVSADGATNTLLPLERLESAYRAALREQALVPDRGRSSLATVVSESEIRATLKHDETLLEFYIVRETVCAFLINRDGVRFQKAIAPLRDVLHAARRFRYQLQRLEMMRTAGCADRNAEHLHDSVQNVLRQLYRLLLQPVEALLEKEKLTIVPHGALHGLPFHAFFDGGVYAFEHWELAYAPSATIWHLGRQRVATPVTTSLTQGEALVVGVPAPGIQGVSVEVNALAALLPGAHVLESEQATLTAFQADAGQCRIIHLATHAIFRTDNPLFSGLRFADDWLLARDLYEMTLDSCELATLSACRTGMASVVSGDESFGLVRGFLGAGVRSVAASLWPADDAATTDLMICFYTLLTQGYTKAAALRAAQRQLRNRFAHPYHWAAFALMGER